jgi:hypothetical protein
MGVGPPACRPNDRRLRTRRSGPCRRLPTSKFTVAGPTPIRSRSSSARRALTCRDQTFSSRGCSDLKTKTRGSGVGALVRDRRIRTIGYELRMAATDVLAEILRLPLEERARLALELIRSLDGQADPDAPAARAPRRSSRRASQWPNALAAFRLARCCASQGVAGQAGEDHRGGVGGGGVNAGEG